MASLEDTLRRLKEERDAADKRYNDALTLLDRALPRSDGWPQPRLGGDDSQLATLNEAWNTLVEPPAASGWRQRLTGFIWRAVAPNFQRQLTFNSRLVDHLNRNANAAREAHRVAEEAEARRRDDLARVAEFHSKLLLYLQQITAYIDTRDRDVAGKGLVLNASLSGVAENLDKRWESLKVREQRLDARAASLESGQAELRTLIGVSQQAVLSLKRELERALSVQGVQPVQGVQEVHNVHVVQKGASRDVFGTLDSYKYVGFEDQFRGSREAIRERLEGYLPFFRDSADAQHPVLDVGCGRGEFLELLGAAGVPARGIDLNHEMVEQCRSRSLDVTEADAVGYLSTLDDGSLGGLFAAQVVEHLQPAYLLEFLELAFHKIRPGGQLVLETLNPACWVAFFDSYIRDITHVWPLHPDTLKYLVLASGFMKADVEYRSPVAPPDRLQPIAAPALASSTESLNVADLVETFNANVEKLNARIFTNRDYAIVASR
jgi:SAM-dependent methyltransferase